MILRKSPSVPAEVTAGGETLAVRVPNHRVAQELIRAVGAPLTGTSANRSGEADPVTAGEVLRQMSGRVGPCCGLRTVPAQWCLNHCGHDRPYAPHRERGCGPSCLADRGFGY